MTTPATTTEAIVITEYERLEADIAIAAKEIDGQTFAYETPAGNKAARSVVHQLRKLNGRIEAARKQAKAYAIAYGRRVDSQAKELKDRVAGLIEPHRIELERLERLEQKRKDAHRAVIDRIGEAGSLDYLAGQTSDQIAEVMREIEAIETTALEEFQAEADHALINATRVLRREYEGTVKREEEALELERLRREEERRQQEERERLIREEAERMAREAAEAAAQQEREEAERRHREEIAAKERSELESRLAAERAERERQEASERAERLEREAEERRRVEMELQRQKEEREAREREAAEQRTEEAVRRIAKSIRDVCQTSRPTCTQVAEAIASARIELVAVQWCYI